VPRYVKSGGFQTTGDLAKETVEELRTYMRGFLNGLLAANFVGAPENCLTWLRSCLAGVDDVQLAHVLSKYVQANPEKWHYGAQVSTWMALKGMCEGLGFPPNTN
jgi:hypothetical protein